MSLQEKCQAENERLEAVVAGLRTENVRVNRLCDQRGKVLEHLFPNASGLDVDLIAAALNGPHA